jgi:hypothetical protein
MPIDKEVQKEAIKEAFREWMDDNFATFGKWAFKSALVAAFSALVYLALKGKGVL